MKKYLLLVAMLLAACGQKDADKSAAENAVATDENVQYEDVVGLSEQDSGSIVTIKAGQEVEVELKANATTGYSWQYITYVKDDGIVEEVDERYVADENPEGMVGVGGKSFYKIKTLKPGEAIIVANYVRDEDKANVDNIEENDFAVRLEIE